MKKATITFNDDFMLQGAKAAAKEQGISFSEYVTGLVGLDLQLRLQYKLVAFYDNGDTNEETDFYSDSDLAASVIAYDRILKANDPLPCYAPEEVRLVAYEIWKHGELQHREEI